MLITVLIPTYRRSKDLTRCLEALQQQTRQADEVLIVVRDHDDETWTLLNSLHSDLFPVHPVVVQVPGQIAALNAGLNTAQGQIIAIIDDDTAPHINWLERIEAHFLADDQVGGVGGRDWIYVNGNLHDASMHPGASEIVGQLQWFGRMIGNNHIGTGKPREVDILKGANMSYRRSAITGLRFDQRLRGSGAESHNDCGFSLAVKRRGWRLIYDPAVAVDHYLGQCLGENQRRQGLSYSGCCDTSHNETLVLLDYLPPIRRAIYLIWAVIVGTRSERGFVQWLRFLPKEGLSVSSRKLLASLQGRWQGWQTWRQSFKPGGKAGKPGDNALTVG